MSILTLESIAVSFGSNDILTSVSVEVNHGDRIGLVGTNGAGKTTLLRVLAGRLEPTAGRRSLARSAGIGLVEQQVAGGDPTHTVMEEARSAIRDLLDLEAQLQKAAERLGDAQPEHDEQYNTLLNRFEARGGFTYQNLLKQTLIGLGFREIDWQKPIAVLSGASAAA
jgi:ATPase subunit of ABC transporter with duplicated ATPase domains